MRRHPTTVCCVIGAGPAELDRFAAAANVRVVRTEPADAAAPDEPLGRAVAAWRSVGGSGGRFTLHDADPLAAVGAAWTELYDHHRRGPLEVAVSALVDAWRSGTVEMPDYYLVLRPDELAVTLRHWLLGVVAGWAPARLIPAASAAAALAALGRLPSSRWWPPLDEALGGIDRVVPDALAGPPGPP